MPNGLRLRISGNQKISGEHQHFIELLPSALSSSRNENFVSTSKNLLENRNWSLPVVGYLIWELEFVSNILWMIVEQFRHWFRTSQFALVVWLTIKLNYFCFRKRENIPQRVLRHKIVYDINLRWQMLTNFALQWDHHILVKTVSLIAKLWDLAGLSLSNDIYTCNIRQSNSRLLSCYVIRKTFISS